MARQRSDGEFNTFVKGLVTEAGPLTFPENASVVENNWVLNKDGSRRRRLGMDFEANFQNVFSPAIVPSTGSIAFSSFLWDNAGGNPDLQFIVIQTGSYILFVDRDAVPLSSGLGVINQIAGISEQTLLTYASIDGRLVVASGQANLAVFFIDDTGGINSEVFKLKTRDLFGLADISEDSIDLLDGHGITTRPIGVNDNHIYNLRNQTWGPPRSTKTTEPSVDPIVEFINFSFPTGDVTLYDGTVDPDTLIIKSKRTNSAGTFVKGTIGEVPTPIDTIEELEILLITKDGTMDYEGTADLDNVFINNFLSFDGGVWVQSSTSPRISEGAQPSNADAVTEFLFPDTASSGSKTLDRFHAEDASNTLLGTSRAAAGYFIIDVLDRGASRLEEYQALRLRFPQLQFPISAFPLDSTPGGATVLSNYAGRVFYAGFTGDVSFGDSQSPNLSSYIFFSQLVNSNSDISRCYQAGDPTSKEAPDLVDTDGGFVKIDGAYGIKKLVPIGKNLLIFATNGVWSLSGGTDTGFTATNFLIEKISEHGIIGSDSVVVVDNTVIFWGLDSIYQVLQNKFGIYESINISKNTIQTFYETISDEDKTSVQGFYDSYDNKVRWLYGLSLNADTVTRELVLDTVLQAFYPVTIGEVSGGLPVPISIIEVPPFTLSSVTEDVTHLGEDVTHLGEQVTFTSNQRVNATREAMYITITSVSPLNFTFSAYRDANFVDWVSFDSTGVDAPANMITGWTGTGDFKKFKQVPYLYMHFFKTETGFTTDVNGDFVPVNATSCLTQVQWDWANSNVGNRFGRQFQAYRHKRLFFPPDINDPFDDGELVVTTRNKLRGKGRVFSFNIETEPGKDLHLLGWSLSIEENANV